LPEAFRPDTPAKYSPRYRLGEYGRPDLYWGLRKSGWLPSFQIDQLPTRSP
jgi:hypothetical protein